MRYPYDSFRILHDPVLSIADSETVPLKKSEIICYALNVCVNGTTSVIFCYTLGIEEPNLKDGYFP